MWPIFCSQPKVNCCQPLIFVGVAKNQDSLRLLQIVQTKPLINSRVPSSIPLNELHLKLEITSCKCLYNNNIRIVK